MSTSEQFSEAEVHCPICREFYGPDNYPKALKCQHVLCLPCLRKHQPEHNTVLCPQCNAVHQFRSDSELLKLKTPYDILEAAEKRKWTPRSQPKQTNGATTGSIRRAQTVHVVAATQVGSATVASSSRAREASVSAASSKVPQDVQTKPEEKSAPPPRPPQPPPKRPGAAPPVPPQHNRVQAVASLPAKAASSSSSAQKSSETRAVYENVSVRYRQPVEAEPRETVAPQKHSATLNPTSQLKKLVILFLGETGAGKSTCINAISNYILYNSFEEALQGPLTATIPCRFYMTDDRFQHKKIEVGASSNENFESGKSATQRPRVYQFLTEKYHVYLIDTPGIDDSEGIEQDKKNMNEILHTLADFPALSVVCLFMKSNNARLTMNLSYCLSELLLRLHRDAISNLCFIFTNARGTFYKPGDSLPTLRVFLERLKKDRGIAVPMTKDNMFCLDNEAFRLVCASHQGFNLKEDQKKDFAESWTRSSSEIMRFLEFAADRTPHETQKTLSLNNVVTMILRLAKPLADVAQLNQDNIALANRYLRDLEAAPTTLGDLVAREDLPQETLIFEDLSEPVMVCTSAGCIGKKLVLNSNNQYQVEYKQVCHKRCYPNITTRDFHPEPSLEKNTVMDRGKCKICGCHWSMHMRLFFKQYKGIEMRSNRMDTEPNPELMKLQMLENVRRHVRGLEKEQTLIRRSCASFAKYLNECAIVPHEDVFRQHMIRVLEEERRLFELGCDGTTYQALGVWLQTYDESRRRHDHGDVTKNPAASGDTDKVAKALGELFRIPHSGAILKDIYSRLERAEVQHTQATVVSINSRWEPRLQSESRQTDNEPSTSRRDAPRANTQGGPTPGELRRAVPQAEIRIPRVKQQAPPPPVDSLETFV